MNCIQCSAPGANFEIGSSGLNKPLCEPCADRMAACEHASGDVEQHFGSDGAGYKTWRCAACGFAEFDALS